MFLLPELMKKCNESDPLPTYANCIRDVYGKYAVHEAAANGNLATVIHLHNQGNKMNIINANGLTPMVSAALGNHWNVVRYLRGIICPKKKRSKYSYKTKIPDSFRL